MAEMVLLILESKFATVLFHFHEESTFESTHYKLIIRIR